MKTTIRLMPMSAVCVNLSFDQWSEVVNDKIMKRVRAPWIIGDLLNYGDDAFGEKHAQVLDECIMQQHTLENWRWVCRAVPPPRRRGDLSFSHHETVARMPDKQQDAWLDLAAKKRLSVHDLRDAVKDKVAEDVVVIDERFASDYKQWVDETAYRVALLKEIRSGKLEVVGFDKQKHTPVVKRIVKATKTSARVAA